MVAEARAPSLFIWQPSITGSTSYTPNALNQYTAIGTQTTGGTNCSGATQGLSYDCNGNLTYDGSFTYGYDAVNRLLTASKTGLAASYQYDPLGRRTHKSGTGVTERYYLNDGTDEIAEYDANKAVVAYYVPGPAIDEPIAMVTGTAAPYAHAYFHTNHQGSVIATTTDDGSRPEGPFNYDPYGTCYFSTTTTKCGTPTTPYRFTGRRFDPETGLLYYRARYYDSNKGRFLQTDPVGYSVDLNLYSYVGNDPTDETDPTGMACEATRINTASSSMCGGTKDRDKDAGSKDNQKTHPARASTGSQGSRSSGARPQLQGFPSDMLVDAVGLFSGASELKGAVLGLARALGLIEGAEATKDVIVLGGKIEAQMARRGWTEKSIRETIEHPSTTRPAMNRATGNSSTAYFSKDGSYVVRENGTGRVVQISNKNDPNWIPDPSIKNPP